MAAAEAAAAAKLQEKYELALTCSSSTDGSGCTWKSCSDGSTMLMGCNFDSGKPTAKLPGGGTTDSLEEIDWTLWTDQIGTDQADECGPNRFTARDGNARRRVVDLRVAGALNAEGLLWTRTNNSVPVPLGRAYFGFGGSWRHNWQYELIEQPAPNASRPNYVLIVPTGAMRLFKPDAQGGWANTVSFATTLLKTDDGFDVISASGEVSLHFVRHTSPNGQSRYQMETLSNAQGLQVNLVYNEQGFLTQVTEPNGRFLKLSYKKVPHQVSWPSGVGEIPAAPAPGEWVELVIPAKYQKQTLREFCLCGEKDGKLAVAEVQFFVKGSSQPLTGTVVGTGDRPETVFDGDAQSGFVGTRELDNQLYFKLDVPEGTAVERVRVLALAGQEASLQGAWLQVYRTARALDP